MEETDSRAAEVAAQALDLPDGQRKALVDRACAGDAELRGEVERLIGLGSRLVGFLNVTHDYCTQLPGAARFGRYRILRLISEGGMGTVYEAQQDHPHRRVALKVIKLGMDTRQVIARFEAEREALGIMDHPNVAKVFDAGSTDTGRPYFVMELVRGDPITEYCDANHLGVRARLELFTQACRAVHHAHQKGIIHRDLKPSNILVAMVDGKPVPKVIDFGVAKAIHHKLTAQTLVTEFRQLVGTPQYMSPEQAEMTGIDIDTRSDVYSLGVLLYELLTGTTPFTATELRRAGYDEVRRLIREVEPPRPSTRLGRLGGVRDAPREAPREGADADNDLELPPSAPEVARRRNTDPATLQKTLRRDLDWIVMKALEKDRTGRYDTAAALAADVERFLSDQPVLAAPPGIGYRLRKFARRNRPVIRTVLIVTAGLVLGAVGVVFGLERAKAERARAAAAEPLLLDNYTRLKADGSASLDDKRSAVRNLIGLYRTWGKPEKVTQWQGELDVLEALVHARLAGEHAMRREWGDAAREYDQTLRRDRGNQWWWYQSACLRAFLGDDAAYALHCRELLGRFSGDGDPKIVERTDKACLLRPIREVDAIELSRMIDRSLQQTDGHPLRGWFDLAKGIAEYRAGRPNSAELHLQRSLEGDMSPQGRGTAWMLLAMVNHKQGYADEARKAMEAGTGAVADGFRDSKASPPGPEWHDWIVFELFRREAESLVAPG